MKKIVSTTPPLNRPADVHPDAQIELPVPELVKEVQPVPKATAFGVNLKKYESFRVNRSQVKLSNQELIAMQQLGSWLGSVDVKHNSMNLELIADIASFAEQYFVYGHDDDRKASIDRCVIQTILPYCKDDEEVARALLKSVSHKIKRSTRASRRLTKIRLFFSAVANIFLLRSQRSS